MAVVPHIIFRRRGALFGLSAASIREITWLPELTAVEDTPACVAGVMDMRGRIIPVMDLSMFFGHETGGYILSDAVVVVESGQRLAGIIVNEIIDMVDVLPEAVQRLAESGVKAGGERRLVTGEIKVAEELAMVLDVEVLMQSLSAGAPMTGAVRALAGAGRSKEEQKIFHARAVNLGKSAEDIGGAGLQAVAVLVMNNEYFGIDLDVVREFSDISGLVPVPCCPPHVLGGMNLRGSVVTVVDIRGALGMPPVSMEAHRKAVIADGAGFLAAVAIDDVIEVIYVKASDVKPSESVVQYGGAYIKGAIAYGDSMIAYIDLGKILSREDMAVNEEV